MRVIVGDRVYIVGQPGEYLVMRIDLVQQTADLMTTAGIRRIEENVPVASLRRIGDSDPQVLHTPTEPSAV